MRLIDFQLKMFLQVVVRENIFVWKKLDIIAGTEMGTEHAAILMEDDSAFKKQYSIC